MATVKVEGPAGLNRVISRGKDLYVEVAVPNNVIDVEVTRKAVLEMLEYCQVNPDNVLKAAISPSAVYFTIVNRGSIDEDTEDA